MSSDLIITHPDRADQSEETDAGLIVPAHAIQRESETWISDEIKKLDRAILMLKKHDVEMVLVCQVCHKPLSLVVREEDKRIALQCKHKERVFKRDL